MQTSFVVLMIVLICLSANNFVYVYRNKEHKYHKEMLVLNAVGFICSVLALIIGTITKD